MFKASLVSLILIATAAPAPAAAARPPGYDAAVAGIRHDGRALTRLVVAHDAAALRARFTPELRAALSGAELAELFRQAGPIGRRTGESALPLSRDARVYIADRGPLAVELVLDRRGRASALTLKPQAPLGPDPAVGHRPRNRLRLPLLGTWWVFWGGPDERRNYHVVAPDQRHAYDLVRWRRGGTHRGDGSHRRQYYAWNRRVVAPADGTVVAAQDGVRDNRPQVEVSSPGAPAGNHVLLDLGEGEYALLAHLRRGTVRVRPGDRVRAGDPLGRVGNSGNSSEPHLHFHLQDGPRPLAGIGLPVVFRPLTTDGRRRSRATPVQGQFVSARR